MPPLSPWLLLLDFGTGRKHAVELRLEGEGRALGVEARGRGTHQRGGRRDGIGVVAEGKGATGLVMRGVRWCGSEEGERK